MSDQVSCSEIISGVWQRERGKGERREMGPGFRELCKKLMSFSNTGRKQVIFFTCVCRMRSMCWESEGAGLYQLRNWTAQIYVIYECSTTFCWPTITDLDSQSECFISTFPFSLSFCPLYLHTFLPLPELLNWWYQSFTTRQILNGL